MATEERDGMGITGIMDIVDIMGMDIKEIKPTNTMALNQAFMVFHLHLYLQICFRLFTRPMVIIFKTTTLYHNKRFILPLILIFTHLHPLHHHLNIKFTTQHLIINLLLHHHLKNKCIQDIIGGEGTTEGAISTIKKVEKAVIPLVLALVPHKNQTINQNVRNQLGGVNKSTLPLVLKRLKSTRDKFMSTTPSK